MKLTSEEIIGDNEAGVTCLTETRFYDEFPLCVTDIDGYTSERKDRVDWRRGAPLLHP